MYVSLLVALLFPAPRCVALSRCTPWLSHEAVCILYCKLHCVVSSTIHTTLCNSFKTHTCTHTHIHTHRFRRKSGCKSSTYYDTTGERERGEGGMGRKEGGEEGGEGRKLINTDYDEERANWQKLSSCQWIHGWGKG